MATGYDWSVKPFLDRFDGRPLSEIRTADVQELRCGPADPRVIGCRPGLRVLSPATVNRILDLLRHMLTSGRSRAQRESPKNEANALKEMHLGDWLGVRGDVRNWLLSAA